VAIDVQTPGSPGWWLWKLSEEQRRRRKTFDEMWARYEGNPKLPEGAESAAEAYRQFQKKARSNFAELVVQAVLERLGLLGFRTSDDQRRRETTDPTAMAIWAENQMAVEADDLTEFFLVMGFGYTITGPPEDDDEDSLPVITAEDPREVITAHDSARPSRVLAGSKIRHNEEDDVDEAFVYLPGEGRDGRAEVWRARRRGKGTVLGPAFRFAPKGWDWDHLDDGDPLELPVREVPVTRYRNRRGQGEFWAHTDLLDRIDHMVLQRMVIATLQAFRQRAVKGLPSKDKDGKEIDYTDIFTADPGALWLLPAAAEMWESGQVDLTPILNSVKEDVRHFAALTRTPMSYFNPDAANGSAEGASLMREGLVFKAEDRQARLGIGHTRTMGLALRMAGKPELARTITPLWAPAERFSLAQRYDAGLKAKQQDVPWRTRMLDILQFTPEQVARMEVERMQDTLLAPADRADTDADAAAAGGEFDDITL